MGLFKKKVPTGPPPAVSTNTFEAPPEGDYPNLSVAGLGNGLAGWAPTEQGDFAPPGYAPGFRLEPPPDEPPAEFYRERNEQNLKRGEIEDLDGANGWAVQQYEDSYIENPNLHPPMPTRPSGYLSPSNYRFILGEDGVATLPLGLKEPRHLNGNHFSGASNLRAYPIGGMQPATHFRNTYRIQPPNQGNAGLTDLPPEQGNPVPTQVTSPSLSPNPSSYRLGT